MRGTHSERGARAYNGGLGRSLVRGSGEAERFSALECPKEAAFWPYGSFGNLRKPL